MATTETTGARIDWEVFREAVPEVLTGMAQRSTTRSYFYWSD